MTATDRLCECGHAEWKHVLFPLLPWIDTDMHVYPIQARPKSLQWQWA